MEDIKKLDELKGIVFDGRKRIEMLIREAYNLKEVQKKLKEFSSKMKRKAPEQIANTNIYVRKRSKKIEPQ